MSDYLTALRARVGPRKVIVVYATALVRDAAGRVLFQRRTDFDWWGLPGGVLELGETLNACAVREVKEETGLSVAPIRLVGVYSGPQYSVRYPNGDEVQQWTAALECRIVGADDGQADGVETAAQAFFSVEAPPPTSPWYAAMLRDLRAGGPAAVFEPPRPRGADEHGATILHLRALMGKAWLIAPGATAFLRDEAGRVLLVRRADTGQWMLPSGYMDLGESVAETIVREMREETGLQVEPVRLISAATGPEYQVTYLNGDPVQVVTTLFECRLLGGQLQLDHNEITAAEFFTPQALPAALTARTAHKIAEAFSGQPHAAFS